MRARSFLRLLLIVTLLHQSQTSAGPPGISPGEAETFEKYVRPVLAERCWPCHGGKGRPKGGLRLTSRQGVLEGGASGPAAVAGEPGASLMIQALSHVQEPQMPPKAKLPDREIEALTRWVANGLPWPATAKAGAALDQRPTTEASPGQGSHWSFRPITPGKIPIVGDPIWTRSPVDRFILVGLERAELGPAPEADRRTLIRRATFDLIGLPPTPEEIEDFLADPSPLAFERVVDRLLASPRYGERWARHWLDLVRYADARDLIQLPAESDFREAWRYRDWAIAAFNRDMPYPEFVRYQIAGDLLPPTEPGGINRDGLVATGALAIADFVPGDVDKEQMIADYVNDQIDFVSKAFLGLTIACARCHDHKFDPISAEDYYGLAGIFFSTRLVPGPVPGNTPLVRAPLLSPRELAEVEASNALDRRRRAELERMLPDAVDRAFISFLRHWLANESARYLVSAVDKRQGKAGYGPQVSRRKELHDGLLAGLVAYLGNVSAGPASIAPATLRDAAAGRLTGPALREAADRLQDALAASVAREAEAHARSSTASTLARSLLVRLRADDPQLSTDDGGRVILWPDRAGLTAGARMVGTTPGPRVTRAMIRGRVRTTLRFDGDALLELPRRVPPNGTLFAVFKAADSGSPGGRLLGWEDSDVGKHGLGLLAKASGGLHAIVRHEGQSGDIVDARPATDHELLSIGWGPSGVTMHRNGLPAGSGAGVEAVSSDPGIAAMRLGGPGSGGAARFRGELAEVRVYDRPLGEMERRAVEAELRTTWLDPAAPEPGPSDPIDELRDEWLSARGPFWLAAEQRTALLSDSERARLDALRRELDALKKRPASMIPRAVVVLDGGPKGTRHEGFHDAPVFIRGDHKRLGKVVPRGVPLALRSPGEPSLKIASGSGRLQLAGWLSRADNPLTARVMANRIWQHHFGQGLVRTPNDFGTRGERPTDPALLDWVAAQFVESRWSIKTMHRLIMLTATYRQGSRPGADALAKDPDNRLLGRMNRRRLDAEAIRDSLLAVSGCLDSKPGGPAFPELATPRRSIYLQSVRTGPTATDFGRLFDRADPGSIVAGRGESVVAPQALFFLNDPFVGEMARALADRLAREEPRGGEDRIRRLHLLTLGRSPSHAELELGLRFLATDGDRGDGPTPWERYCHLLLCQNEFIFID